MVRYAAVQAHHLEEAILSIFQSFVVTLTWTQLLTFN